LSSDKPLISVVIPALNEAETISQVIREVVQYTPYPDSTEIIVVDGGSEDGTQNFVLENGAKLIIEPRRGYGRAIRTGLENVNGEVIVIVDADGTYEVSDMPKLVEPLLKDKADVSLAARIGGKILPGAMPRFNYVGNCIFTWLYNKLYKQEISDTQTGFRALTRKALAAIKLIEEDMAISTEILTKAAKEKLRVIELPSTYKHRVGKPKLKRFKAGRDILRTLFFDLL